MWSFSIKKALVGLLTSFLIAGFFLQPLGYTGKVQTAEAGPYGLEITQIGNAAINSVSAVASVASAGFDALIDLKEFELDAIAFYIAKIFVQSITRSLINWINSGFQGNPAFVSDLKGFMLDAADQAVGDFLFNNDTLDFLCSPFSINVQSALAVRQAKDLSNREQYKAECSLSDVTDNIEGFLSGDFIGGGGWNSWYEQTQNPSQNTAVGSLLDLEFQIDTLINDEIHRETLTLSFGDGFLSQKECDENGANCTINTPGKAISEALTFHLSVGTRTLIEADEINEIISALFSQLALKAISGVGGLLGMSGKSKYSSGGSSYLDRLREDYLTKDVNSVTNGIGSGYTPTAQVFSPVDDPGVTPISAAQQAQYDALISQLAQQIASYGQLYNENGEPVDIEIPPVDPVTGEPPAGYPESVDPP